MLDVKIPIFDAVGTGENITKLRKQKHLSVREIQEVFGLETPQATYKWQHGSAMPTIENLAILAAIFEVKVDDILVFHEQQAA